MDLSMTLPTMIAHGRAEVLAWCRGIDEGPFASLAVPERITYPAHSMIVQLAAAAALTERVRLWTTIVILPAHDAVDMAKQLASVDRLCDGRLTVGVGVGGREHDYRAINGNFARRWARMDDQVATMKRIWAGEPPFEGADPVGPPPVQAGGPPFIGGSMGPKSIARAAKWAAGVDGAFTTDGNREAIAGPFEMVRQAWRDAGRTDAPHLSTSFWYALGPDAEDRLRSYAYSYMKIFGEDVGKWAASAVTLFTPQAVHEAVENVRDAGANELFLVPTTTDPDELIRTRDALGI